MKHSFAMSAQGRNFAGAASNLSDKLHEVLSALNTMPSDVTSSQMQSSTSEKDVRSILKARRARSQFFSDDLFADPAWDILLELYGADLGQRRITISSLCIGAAVPATTALRWIGSLEKKGLLTRHNDPLDGRRVYASLSETGRTAMKAYFSEVARNGTVVI